MEIKTNRYNLVPPLLLLLIGVIALSCSQHKQGNTASVKKPGLEVHTKPASSFNDTMLINNRSAVFYEPDSMQLVKIKSVTDEMIFKGSMHEYEFQQKNAKQFIRSHWPEVKIIAAKNVRYLLFLKNDRTSEVVDLNAYNDAFGLFLFDGSTSPRFADMTNIDTEVPVYFSH